LHPLLRQSVVVQVVTLGVLPKLDQVAVLVVVVAVTAYPLASLVVRLLLAKVPQVVLVDHHSTKALFQVEVAVVVQVQSVVMLPMQALVTVESVVQVQTRIRLGRLQLLPA
jgi:hypothetical protein